MAGAGGNFAEKRHFERAPLALRGRYMLSDGAEFPCETIDISPSGLAIKCEVVGYMGERVVVYLDEIGRVEGVIVRRAIGWFAISARAPQSKYERIAQRIAWLMVRKSQSETKSLAPAGQDSSGQ